MKGTIYMLAAALVLLVVAQPASAQRYSARLNSQTFTQITRVQPTYQVQVEYWFFDTTSYHWSTVFETTNFEDAWLMYDLLMLAKSQGSLIQFVPSDNPRYIPVDVRLRTVYPYYLSISWW